MLPQGCNVEVHVGHREVGLVFRIVIDGELEEFIIFNIIDFNSFVTPIRISGDFLFL